MQKLAISFNLTLKPPEFFQEMVGYYKNGYFCLWIGNHFQLIDFDSVKLYHFCLMYDLISSKLEPYANN